MKSSNKEDKTAEYDYDNNRFDEEQEYRQSQHEEFEKEEGKFREGQEREYENAGDVGRKGKGKGRKGRNRDEEGYEEEDGKEEDGFREGDTQFYFDEEGIEEDVESSDDGGYQSSGDEDNEQAGRRKSGKVEKEAAVPVYVVRKKGGKRVFVKKRKPIRIVNIEEMLKSNWWNLAQESVGRMAEKCYRLCEDKEKRVQSVRDSFLSFITTGLKLGPHQISSPFAFWSDIKHDKECSSHHTLAKLALCMINTLASEAPCERVFSKMKMLIGDRRCNLSARTVFHMFVIAGI
jgi:hypothetical protein